MCIQRKSREKLAERRQYILREYDSVGIAKWFFHENSWFGQFRHALSKYAKKNIPSCPSFRDIYDRISTIFRQIFKIRIFIAVKKISQFQNGKRKLHPVFCNSFLW
jgi:hypothetical protein